MGRRRRYFTQAAVARAERRQASRILKKAREAEAREAERVVPVPRRIPKSVPRFPHVPGSIALRLFLEWKHRPLTQGDRA